MAYNKQNFVKGMTLTADHLKNMEDGIINNEVTFVAGEGIAVQDYCPKIVSYQLNTNIGADGKTFSSWNGRIAIEEFFETGGQTPVVVYSNNNLGSLNFAYRYYTSDKVTIASNVSSSVYCRIVIVPESAGSSATDGTILQDASVVNTIFTVNDIAYQLNNDGTVVPCRTVFISNNDSGAGGNSLEYDDYVMQIFEKIACIGDSLTAGYTNKNGELFGSNDAREAKRNWPTYLGKRLGSEIVNLGYGSTSTHSWRYNDDNLGADITQAEVSDIQCYCIGLGANDLRQNKTIGSTSDIKSDYNQNNDTCYGNYHYIVSRLLAFNPNAHIFCFTVPNCENNYGKFNPVVRHICSLYAGKRVHLIDLEKLYPTEYKTAMFNTCNNGHFIPLIYNIMSVYIQKAISDYMVTNYTQFYGAPYNGK